MQNKKLIYRSNSTLIGDGAYRICASPIAQAPKECSSQNVAYVLFKKLYFENLQANKNLKHFSRLTSTLHVNPMYQTSS